MPKDKEEDDGDGSAARTTKNSIKAFLAWMAAMLAMSKTIEDNVKNMKESMADVIKSITENEEWLNMAIYDKIIGLRDELKRDLTANINQNVADIKSNKSNNPTASIFSKQLLQSWKTWSNRTINATIWL
jgi:hypothetical protein